eukprot:s70_g9.t1
MAAQSAATQCLGMYRVADGQRMHWAGFVSHLIWTNFTDHQPVKILTNPKVCPLGARISASSQSEGSAVHGGLEGHGA